MIEGLSHITFIVHDLEKMTHVLTTIFDAKEVYSSGDQTDSHSREKFFLISDVWVAVMEGNAPIGKTYNHVSFKIAEDDFDKYVERVKALGVEIREDRERLPGEGSSLYFYDFDNHLFELHTGTLERRLEQYGKTKKI